MQGKETKEGHWSRCLVWRLVSFSVETESGGLKVVLKRA